MKNFSLLLLLALSIALFSCNDEIEQVSGDTKLTKFDKDTVDKSDKVILYGQFMKITPLNSYILIGDNIKILSNEAISWNNSIIEFVAPDSAGTFPIRIVLGKDTSNILNLTIRQHPVFEMVEIPAGNFQMGSSVGLDDESPIHTVNITNTLLCSKFEISFRLWHSVMKTTAVIGDKDYPINYIEWTEVIKFCNTLSKLDKLDTCYIFNGTGYTLNTSAKGFRLPTEAEWEYLCKAGTSTDYSGDGVLNNMGWYNLNSGNLIHKPGLKKANAFGLYDMHGNLAEWCWDNYSADYYSTSPENNPLGAGNEGAKCVRGGSYNSGTQKTRSAARDSSSVASEFIGFRIVRNK